MGKGQKPGPGRPKCFNGLELPVFHDVKTAIRTRMHDEKPKDFFDYTLALDDPILTDKLKKYPDLWRMNLRQFSYFVCVHWLCLLALPRLSPS